MLYERMTMENGQLKVLESREVDQSALTADCWLVQFRGLAACTDCPAFNSPDCGGGLTLWSLIDRDHGLPPVVHYALAEVQESDPDRSAYTIGQGQTGTDWDRLIDFSLKSAWRWYVRKVRDQRLTATAATGDQDLTHELVDRLCPLVGTAAMVAGYRSNTFGGIVSRDGQLYILSLNTRTFRLCYDFRDWRHTGDKSRRLPWLTPTSADSLRSAVDCYDHWDRKSDSRHLRFYGGSTNAPTQRARHWVVDQGYRIIV